MKRVSQCWARLKNKFDKWLSIEFFFENNSCAQTRIVGVEKLWKFGPTPAPWNKNAFICSESMRGGALARRNPTARKGVLLAC